MSLDNAPDADRISIASSEACELSLFTNHRQDLAKLAQGDRLRSLRARTGVDFSSNDYLGLANCDALRKAALDAINTGVALGSGGSRLLRGNCFEHELLESAAAQFFGSESALFFATGFAANMAILSTLPQRGDLVLYDELIHASAHDGMRLGRAECRPFRHNDVSALEGSMVAWRREGGTGSVWIAVESLYSMDGDRAPLSDLAVLADAYDAILLVDEAHATGVFGSRGEGLAGHLHQLPNVITLHTLGKALGWALSGLCGMERTSTLGGPDGTQVEGQTAQSVSRVQFIACGDPPP